MKKTSLFLGLAMMAFGYGAYAQSDITQPGDPIIASSPNSPGSEAVANAIDGQPTKYLNFDTRIGGKPSGFAVSPSLGRTVVTGVSLQSANDAPERDPKVISIEGSNDDSLSTFDAGNWESIAQISDIPAFPNRFQTQEFFFPNIKPYKHYRFTVLETQTANTCCFQIAEVELLGAPAPKDVTQPGDAIVASSPNSPGSEAVANAIDGQPTKYLNFDTRIGGKPSGFAVTPGIGRSVVTGVTLTSANDAPERDPKVVSIEGSNDDALSTFDAGNWESIAQISDIPAFPNRFQTQEFFFPNIKPYKHYRFTVLETQTANTCCFQIAEVELLAVTTQVDCTKARFNTQPVDTAVLEGEAATFFVALNGPWPLQWYRNGAAIPGATLTSYTTPAVTAQNASDEYSVKIVGCEESSKVRAQIFQPSAVTSVGVSFHGGGANGTPTRILATDVTGIHPQAYWNDVGAGSGTAGELEDSNNQASDITVTWKSSGEWGAGTGSASPLQRLLNGLIEARPNAPGTITFENVPDGSHTVIAYLVGIPLQFQDADYTIIGQTEQTVHTRVLNADEYNAAPGFFRGTSTDPNNRTLASFVRFDNVQPADGKITLTWSTLTTGFDRGAPVNAIQLLLNAPAPGEPPVISQNPQPATAKDGGTIRLSAAATGSGLTWQWRKNGKTIPDGGNIRGATTSTLTISPFGAADEGVYSVAVFNAAGSALSKNAAARLSTFNINESLVTYFKFDETSGTVADNAATGGIDANVLGAATWTAGKVAGALSFDGATYVKLDNYPKAQRQLSVSAWVNVNDAGGANIALFRNAQRALGLGAGVGPGTPAGQFEVALNFNAEAGAYFLTAAIGAGPNIARATSTEAFTLSSWQHVAVSADGAQLRVYINGVQVASTDYLSAINPPDIQYLSVGVQLDKPAEAEDTVPFETAPLWLTGQVDELAIWRRGITADEALKIFQAGNQGKALTTVVPSLPVVPGKLAIAVSANGLRISWDNGKLQTAPTVNGPWTDSNLTSPVTEAVAGAAKFYRTIAQ